MNSIFRGKPVAVLGFSAFLVGIPCSLSLGILSDFTVFGMGFMDLLDFITLKLMLPLDGFFVSIFAGWVVWDRVQKEASELWRTSLQA